MTPSNFLSVASEAAMVAGTLIRAHWQKPKTVDYKGAIDLVTSVDRESERLIVGYRQVYLVENFLPLHMTIGRVRIRAVAHSCKVWGLLMLRVWRIKSRILRFIASTLPVVVGRFNWGYLR